MPKVFLTPFVLVGLLFLSSCSNAEAKACETAKQSQIMYENKSRNLNAASKAINVKDDWNFNLTEEEKVLRDEKSELYMQSVENYKLSLQTIITYKECFSPSQVVEAQNAIE